VAHESILGADQEDSEAKITERMEGDRWKRDCLLEKPFVRHHIQTMQTRCPKCSTIVRSTGPTWEIINGSCPELAGTPWASKAEFCPILSLVAEPDVALPGASQRAAVCAEIERARIIKVGK
jgi:hypothetical protein